MGYSYNFYSTVADYENKNPSFPNMQPVSVNRSSLIKAAVSVGTLPGVSINLTKEVIEWKTSMMLAFINSKAGFKIKNINQLEGSEKGAVGYFLGMVFAHIYMQEKYGVRVLSHLAHLGKSVKKVPGAKKDPDLWGISEKDGMSYLVEAKGSTNRKAHFDGGKFKIINKAKLQLEAVDRVEYKYKGKIITYSNSNGNLTKLIAATHPNLNGEIIQHIIDPENSEGEVLKIDGDELIYSYYSNLVKLIKSSGNEVISLTPSTRMKFRVIKLEKLNYTVGILESIYSTVNSYVEIEEKSKNFEVSFLEGINENVNTILDYYETSFAEIPSLERKPFGIDGIIALPTSFL